MTRKSFLAATLLTASLAFNGMEDISRRREATVIIGLRRELAKAAERYDDAMDGFVRVFTEAQTKLTECTHTHGA